MVGKSQRLGMGVLKKFIKQLIQINGDIQTEAQNSLTKKQYNRIVHSKSPSSRGLGHRPFKAATRVRIPLGTPFFISHHLYCHPYIC